jgi:hypothetical protein
MNNMIVDEVEIFKVDPSIQRRIGENDIDVQVRIMNIDSPETISENQAILDSWNIIQSFPVILFEHCKLVINEYTDICRKWLDVRKREAIKELIRSKEMAKYDNKWTIESDNLKILLRTAYLVT